MNKWQINFREAMAEWSPKLYKIQKVKNCKFSVALPRATPKHNGGVGKKTDQILLSTLTRILQTASAFRVVSSL